MSRTDLHEAIEAAWAEADHLRTKLAERDQQLEEANATIDAVRKVRGVLDQERRRLERSAYPDYPPVAARLEAVRNAIGMLDGVDGL